MNESARPQMRNIRGDITPIQENIGELRKQPQPQTRILPPDRVHLYPFEPHLKEMASPHQNNPQLSRRGTNLSDLDSEDEEIIASVAIERKSRQNKSISDQTEQKPLIEYITNKWQHDEKYQNEEFLPPPSYRRNLHNPDTKMDEFLDRLDDFYDHLLGVLKSPKFRRGILYFIAVILFCVYMVIKVLKPHIVETRAALTAFEDPTKLSSGGLYGHNRRPTFPDMIQLKTLDPELLPKDGAKKTKQPKSRRLIFVGDIHGCKDELVALLDKVQFDRKRDHLVTTGDMIDKGPDSVGVVDALRNMNASCVRGNHEDRVLLTHSGLERMLDAGVSKLSVSPVEEEAERALARSLSKEQISYLQSCPVILRIGEISAFNGELVVVHGGLVPGIPLENQDPSTTMTMRIIDLLTYTPSRDHEHKRSIPWARLWNKVQNLVPSKQSRFGRERKGKKVVPHMSVVYGHDSKRGLQIQKWTKGLDSGCVKGGKLSALVLSDGGKQHVVQVQCKDHRTSTRTALLETED